MKLKSIRLIPSLFFLIAAFLQIPNALAQESAPSAIRFTVVDVFLNPGGEPLAAWQIDFSAKGGGVKIVGIEGGEHAAFSKPPYYDPKAIQNERVILAAFSTAGASSLPTGKTRVASVHLQVEGPGKPEFSIRLITAARENGEAIKPAISFNERMPNEK